MNQSMRRGRLLAALGAAAIAALVIAPMAQAAEPNPGYGQFAGCPTPEEAPAVELCVSSVVSGGHFQMGNKDVPISNPMTLSGGYGPEGEYFATDKGGLTPAKQQVPGGIIGLTGLDWLVNFLNVESLKLYAVTELAGDPGPIQLGSDLTLPIKVHLINPVLGDNCYVGSDSNPIALNLTTETTDPPPPNEPISGTFPEFGFNPELGILELSNGVFVDNEFSAPGASGCKLKLFGFIPVSINGIVNLASGLPAAAGTNETVQNIDAEIVNVGLVYP